MKVKSRVLLGLILLIVLVGGYSIINQLSEMEDIFNPSDVYACLGDTKTGGFSNVSYASGSAGADAPVGVASSMPSHGAAFSYARAVSAPVGAMGSTSAYSQSPIANRQGLYTTSSAEFRSFGGGGNAGGGVSMSGGTIKSTSSSIAPATSLSISMPSTQVYTYNNGVASSDIAMASSYQGIGNTTGGAKRGIGGRKNLAIGGESGEANVEDTWLNWLALMGIGIEDVGHYDAATNTWYYDYYELQDLYEIFCAGWNSTMGKKPTWDEWLAWFMGSEGNPYKWSDGDNPYKFSFVPVGDYTPLFVLALLYVAVVAYRRRKQSEKNCEKQL